MGGGGGHTVLGIPSLAWGSVAVGPSFFEKGTKWLGAPLGLPSLLG